MGICGRVQLLRQSKLLLRERGRQVASFESNETAFARSDLINSLFTETADFCRTAYILYYLHV